MLDSTGAQCFQVSFRIIPSILGMKDSAVGHKQDMPGISEMLNVFPDVSNFLVRTSILLVVSPTLFECPVVLLLSLAHLFFHVATYFMAA